MLPLLTPQGALDHDSFPWLIINVGANACIQLFAAADSDSASASGSHRIRARMAPALQ